MGAGAVGDGVAAGVGSGAVAVAVAAGGETVEGGFDGDGDGGVAALEHAETTIAAVTAAMAAKRVAVTQG